MDQQSQSTHSYPVELSNELDFIRLWEVLVKYKPLVIAFTILTTLSAMYYTTTIPTIYKTEVLTNSAFNDSRRPSSLGGLSRLIGDTLNQQSSIVIQSLDRLETRVFLVDYIKNNNVKPILFSGEWNKLKKQWNGNEPSDEVAYKALKGMVQFNIVPRTSIISIWVDWKNPGDNLERIAYLANSLVRKINTDEKKRVIKNAYNSIEFLEKEIERTSFVETKKILYGLVEQQLIQITIANVRDDYVFSVIDPAVVPMRPKRKNTLTIIFLGLIFGLLVSSTFLVIFDKLKNN
jgi:capsular polysaccharide biosynthesis protein